MNQVKKMAIKQALKLLDASGCKYYVIDEEGDSYGEVPKQNKSKRKYKCGEMANYFKPYLSEIKVGDVAVIPSGEFDIRSLSGAITAYLSHEWGKQSYKSCTNKKTIEILRCL